MTQVPGVRLRALRRVRVGSTSPPKLEGIRAALCAYAPAVAVEAVAVASGVPEQPLGFSEISAGARQRAAAAFRSGPCELGVGYEDGLVPIPLVEGQPDESWFNVGVAAVTDGDRTSYGLSSGFCYPPSCTAPAVEARRPIGDVFDRVFARYLDEAEAGVASGQGLGNVGRLTDGVLSRAEYTAQAVLCALAPWLHPLLYAPGEGA